MLSARMSSSKQNAREKDAGQNNSGVDEKYQELDRCFDVNNLFLKTMHELLAKGENQNALVPYVDRMRENLMLSADHVEKFMQNVSDDPLVTMFQHDIFQNRSDTHSVNLQHRMQKNRVAEGSEPAGTNAKKRKRDNAAQKKKRKSIVDLPLEIQQVPVPTENPKNCGVWTEEESKKCAEAFLKYKDYAKHYLIIAKCIGGTRTVKQVRDHIGKIKRRKLKKGEVWP